jgi:hypothetical protein
MVSFAPASQTVTWVDRVLTVVIFVLFVSAWGISRRRRPVWIVGLVPTVV